MSDADALLADLWAVDEPPERDPAFVIAAMERIEQRRLWSKLLVLAAMTALVGLIAWAVAPVLAMIGQVLTPDAVLPYAGAALMALFLWSWASDRLQPLEV